MNLRLACTALALAATAALTVVACDKKSDNPAGPSGSTQQVKFTAALLPANEVPAATGAETAASGTVTVTFNLTKDSTGAVIASTADFLATLNNMPAGTSLTAAHIHTGASGVAGPVLINTAIASGEVTFPTGSGTLNKTGIAMSVDNANNIINNPAGFYFNMHTVANPGGVARGQLVKQ